MYTAPVVVTVTPLNQDSENYEFKIGIVQMND